MITNLVRYCSKCKETKPIQDFHRNKYSPDGYELKICKLCANKVSRDWAKDNREESRKRARRSNFKQRHRITGLDEWVNIQLDKQQGICAMVDCNKTLSDNGHALCVDHNHRTNKLRALLCRECNLALDWYEKNKCRHIAFETYLMEYDSDNTDK